MDAHTRLEDLSLSFATDEIAILKLPKTFLPPIVRYLALAEIALPKRLRALTTVSLVMLVLRHIQTSSYFLLKLLVARLSSPPQLEELSIGFSIPIPRPSAERELLGEQGTPVTLPNLKTLRFQGVSAYLESLVAQIRARGLERRRGHRRGDPFFIVEVRRVRKDRARAKSWRYWVFLRSFRRLWLALLLA